jgi:hypothetical protein
MGNGALPNGPSYRARPRLYAGLSVLLTGVAQGIETA